MQIVNPPATPALFFLIGLAFGLFYDLLTVRRKIYKQKQIWIIIQDVLFMTIASIITFIFTLVTNFGSVRFYILASELIGLIIYNITLGIAVRKFLALIILFFKKLKDKIFSISTNFLKKIKINLSFHRQQEKHNHYQQQ